MSDEEFNEFEEFDSELPKQTNKTIQEEQKPLVTDQQIKVIQKAAKESKQLSQNLQSLDYELVQFNNFAHKIKTVKVRGIIWGTIFGVLTGFISALILFFQVVTPVTNSNDGKYAQFFKDYELVLHPNDSGPGYFIEYPKKVVKVEMFDFGGKPQSGLIQFK